MLVVFISNTIFGLWDSLFSIWSGLTSKISGTILFFSNLGKITFSANDYSDDYNFSSELLLLADFSCIILLSKMLFWSINSKPCSVVKILLSAIVYASSVVYI